MERPMNTASKDRVFHNSIVEYIKGTDKRHTPVTRVKLAKTKAGGVNVVVYTSRPNVLRMEARDLAQSISTDLGTVSDISIEVVPEARAVAKFVRTSPRKARLVIDAIKGKRVSEALAVLKFVAKHAVEPITKVLKSAAANAEDGWGATPEELKIANFIADGGPSLKRVRPRAQGRAYRILKRTSHLTVVLTEAPAPTPKRRPQGKKKKTAIAAPAAAAPVAEMTAPAVEGTKIVAAAEAPVVENTAAEPQEATSEAPEEEGGATIEIQEEAEPNQE